MAGDVYEIAERLRNRRVALGLSQRDLAERLGTVQSAVSAWEAGVPGIRVNSLERWCAVLGLRVRMYADDSLEEASDGE